MTNIRVISSKTIVKDSYVEIKEEQIAVENNTPKKYHNVYRSPGVIIYPLTDKYELYLISQYRYLYKKRVLETIVGCVDPGESSLNAAKRELKEEAGLIANQWEEILRGELVASGIKGTVHLFLARGLEEGQASPEIGEDIQVHKLSLEQAVQKAMNGEIHDTSGVAGILILDKLRKEKKI